MILTDWLISPVNLDSGMISKRVMEFTSSTSAPMPDSSLPSVYTGQLRITGDPMDTYLDMSLWGKVKMNFLKKSLEEIALKIVLPVHPIGTLPRLSTVILLVDSVYLFCQR